LPLITPFLIAQAISYHIPTAIASVIVISPTHLTSYTILIFEGALAARPGLIMRTSWRFSRWTYTHTRTLFSSMLCAGSSLCINEHAPYYLVCFHYPHQLVFVATPPRQRFDQPIFLRFNFSQQGSIRHTN
jgi:hypothetical protein